MKKFLILLIMFILLPFNIFASELTISDLKLVSNSNTSGILQEPGIDDLNINFDFSFKNTNDIIKYSFLVHNISDEEYNIKLTNNNNSHIDYSLNTNKINKNGDTLIELTTKYKGTDNITADRHEDSSVSISLLNVINNNKIDSKVMYIIMGALVLGFSIIILTLNKKLWLLIPVVGAVVFLVIPTSLASPLININTNVTLVTNHICNSFKDDSWAQIIHNINNDNISCYNIGDTKEVDLKDLGLFNIRIVNKDINSKCNGSSCGFVLEFTDILKLMPMNENVEHESVWEINPVRKYLNDDIYNNLPEDLKNAIVDTKIIVNEREVTEKLYLPSENDLFISETNQNILEYYKTNETYDKKYNDEITPIWLRDKYDGMNYYGSIVNNAFDYNIETNEYGLSPLFRLK